jgi:nitrite reductase/ring-hydroxylating ferredoxin subunit
LCRFDEIGEDTGKEVSLHDDNTSLCLVRKDAAVYAYVNSCPHTGAPLNWAKDRFLSWDGDMIQCAVHGALFRMSDGRCVWGPCLHRRLTPVPTVMRNGDVMLANADASRSRHG